MTSVRLSPAARSLLKRLGARLGLSQSQAVERALYELGLVHGEEWFTQTKV